MESDYFNQPFSVKSIQRLVFTFIPPDFAYHPQHIPPHSPQHPFFSLHSSSHTDLDTICSYNLYRLSSQDGGVMLGKRARAPMKRTTSMTGITVDVKNIEASTLDHQNPISTTIDVKPQGGPEGHVMVGSSVHDHRSMAMLSPRYYRRDSADHNQRLETANFLRTCELCDRRLGPGLDIYMYRGDTAFCSQECREQIMKQDERKEKYTKAVPKKVESHHNQYSDQLATAASESSTNNETVAAA